MNEGDVNVHIDDFQVLDGADDKVNHKFIFYLSKLCRKIRIMIKCFNPKFDKYFKRKSRSQDYITSFGYVLAQIDITDNMVASLFPQSKKAGK